MQLHTFSFIDQHLHGSAFADYLGLRYRVLVDDFGWDLSNDGSVEMDQYDHPGAVFSVVTNEGGVVAGARALPCNASWGGWSYMLKDAALGKVTRIPDDLLPEYPCSNDTWECTRLVSDDTMLSSRAGLMALRLVVFGLCQEAGGRGADNLISLSPSSFGRLLRMLGYNADPLGREYIGEEDGRLYRAFSMPCDRLVNAGACGELMAPLPRVLD